MTKTTDNYSAFNSINLSNARSENESYKDYRKRLKQNEAILKVYNTVGLDNFKEMFPNGVQESLVQGKYNYDADGGMSVEGAKTRKARPIKNYKQSIDVNKKLSELAFALV